jgi:phosphoribosylformylglycinamidine synthase II
MAGSKAVDTEFPEVTLDLAREHGLTEEEYSRVVSLLGRTPTFTELGIYSVMWSEHCSYKNSIALLKTLPRSGGRLLVGGGEENAGLVDIGDGLAVAFKIESHNHPSAVEPYQGAATGIGGILRDIFTMGARPIAALNSLRFGELSSDRTKYLFKNIVRGIGDYGNSFGVPTVGGEVYFDKCYQGNPLVNAMAVGVVEHGRVAKAVAKGAGNPVIMVGSATGRDGIHGATFASEELNERSESRRPSVQVGDPFTEKKLVEATLEAIATGYVVGIQDMGAAGLTCSGTEMSAKGGVGMQLDLDLVHLREDAMTSYEIMLSESQERMLLVAKAGHEGDVIKAFDKWDLPAIVIGRVTADGLLTVQHQGHHDAVVRPETCVLGGGAPVYNREARVPGYLEDVRKFDAQDLPVPRDLGQVLLKLLAKPSIASKRWVYEQYDSMVRTDTTMGPGGDAAVVRVKGTSKALALTTDCNARYVYLNPRRGAEIAVAEAARNVVCVGAEPLAITNCLNFGNPYDPENYWQFKEAVEGMGHACRELGTPVTGGNVSFYNESPEGAVYPTPVIGMLGLIEDVQRIVGGRFTVPGDSIVLFGDLKGELGGSEYLHMETGLALGDAPTLDLGQERSLQRLLLGLIRAGLVRSAHDTAEGGLAVAVAECCFADGDEIGADVKELTPGDLRPDATLFGEDQSRVIVSCAEANVAAILRHAGAAGIAARVIGLVRDDARLRIRPWVDISIADARSAYYDAIRGGLEGGGG